MIALVITLEPEERAAAQILCMNVGEEVRVLDDLRTRRGTIGHDVQELVDGVISLLEHRAERWAPGDISPRRAA